jgi:hypothetical protein
VKINKHSRHAWKSKTGICYHQWLANIKVIKRLVGFSAFAGQEMEKACPARPYSPAGMAGGPDHNARLMDPWHLRAYQKRNARKAVAEMADF